MIVPGCNNRKESKNPLNRFAFKDKFEAVQDSIIQFCEFGEKLLYNNTANFNFFENGKGEVYLNNVKIGMAEDLFNNLVKLQSINEFKRLTLPEMRRFVTIFQFLKRNYINGVSRHPTGSYGFGYRQDNRGDYNTSRSIVYLGKAGNSDVFMQWKRIIMQEGKLILTSGKDANIELYHEPIKLK